jgi:hypothetical protein
MRRGGDQLIVRRRLIDAASACRVVLLEAPGGYGKSTLAAELAAAFDRSTARVVLPGETALTELAALLARSLGRVGLPEVADSVSQGPAMLLAALERVEGGVTLIVDEVQRLRPDAAAWLADLVDGLPAASRAIVCGRRLGVALAALAVRQAPPTSPSTSFGSTHPRLHRSSRPSPE